MLIFFVLLSYAGSLEKGAAVLIGKQIATYDVPLLDRVFPSYTNNGFSQALDGKTGNLKVHVNNRPLQSRAFKKENWELPSSFSNLEKRLKQKDVVYQTQQVAIIIDWIRTHIQYHPPGLGQIPVTEIPPDQGSELPDSRIQEWIQKGAADCVGLSELTLYILKKIGIKARFVTGVAFRKDDPARLVLKGSVLHRWVEVYYPDAGWVFSDPSGKINYIEATYLVIGIWGVHSIQPRLEKLLGEKIELKTFMDGFKVMRLEPGLDARVGLRFDGFIR